MVIDMCSGCDRIETQLTVHLPHRSSSSRKADATRLRLSTGTGRDSERFWSFEIFSITGRDQGDTLCHTGIVYI